MNKRKISEVASNVGGPNPKKAAPDLSKLTIPQLKEQCRANGLRVGGTKPQLLERLGSAPQAVISTQVRSTSSKESQALKAAGVDDNTIANTDANVIRKTCADFFKSYHKMVDADWHDGYEEQSEAIDKWFRHLQPILQAVHDLAFVRKQFFERCHEIMMIISDTVNNLNTVGARCEWTDADFETNIIHAKGDWEFSESNVIDLFWRIFLSCAATSPDVTEGTLCRWIKDCVDNSISLEEITVDEDGHEWFSEFAEGYNKVKDIFKNHQDKWQSLAKAIKHHATKRIIDRRFDGPKHLRTRDYSSDEESGNSSDDDNSCDGDHFF